MKENFVKYLKSETFIYIVIAYTFSMLVRLIWVGMNGDNSQFLWNNQLMINTNDGYFWAEGARDLIAGFHQENDGSPITYIASLLTAIFYWITPFSLESIIFYLPALLSSLVVIPVILVGRSLGQLHVGFIAALLSSIAWSYYNRTMVGYFDTDMLNIVLPTFLLWSLILAFITQKERYFLFMALDIIAYRLWYPQSYALEFAFFGLILFYVLIFQRKNIYLIKLLTMMLLAMMGLPTLVRVLMVIAFYLLSKKDLYAKYAYHLLIAVFVLFLFTGGFDPIWYQLKGYIFRDSVEVLDKGVNLHYLSVMQTVSEAGQISFERFVNRISGHIAIFVLSIVGFIWLVKEYKVMILSLPLIGLGFLAYGIPGLISGGGLRFTIYAIVPLALGIAFLIVKVSKQLTQSSEHKRIASYYGLLLLGSIAILYPNISHVVDYQVRPVMLKTEVETLDRLKSISKREDYTLAWWDYGYPIRFYSDTKTLTDGGKHSGEVNFPVSVSLTQSQDISAKMARISVEANEKRFKEVKLAKEKGEVYTEETFLQKIFKDNELSSTDELMSYLSLKEDLPRKTRDIYYYLPFKMLNIFHVVESFSTRDLLTGIQGQKGFLRAFPLHNSLDRFTLGPNLYFSKTDGRLHQGNQVQPIKSLIQAQYDQNKKMLVNKQLVDLNSNLHMIILPNYGRILLVDDKALNSSFVQLFFLEQYDKRYFEPVIMSPYAKIYKLKI